MEDRKKDRLETFNVRTIANTLYRVIDENTARLKDENKKMEGYLSEHTKVLEKAFKMDLGHIKLLRENLAEINNRKTHALKAIENERRKFDYTTVMHFIMLVLVLLFIGFGTYYGWNTLSLWKTQTEEVTLQLKETKDELKLYQEYIQQTNQTDKINEWYRKKNKK